MVEAYAHFLQHPVFSVISDVSDQHQAEVYVIGGFVRDCFLDRPCKDIDIVVVGNGPAFAERVAEKLKVKKLSIFARFGTAHFKYKDIDVEFVGARKESYSEDSRKPSTLPGTLQEDQYRRDFTINALAFSLQKHNFGELVDPFHGYRDLEKGIIRTPLDPSLTYSDDPLRMMRAIRFASQLEFQISAPSVEAIYLQRSRISIVSMERIMTEFNKIMLCPKPSRGIYLMHNTGLLPLVFPELVALQGIETVNGHSHKDNFDHTLEVLDNLCMYSDNLWLRWAALLHDIAKPPTKRYEPDHGWTFHGHEELGARMVPKIFKKLRLPLDHKMKYVQKLVRLHLRPIALVKGNVTDSAVRRLLADAGDDIDDLMLLCNSDITSKNEFKVKRYRNNFKLVKEKLIMVEEKDRIRNFQPPVTGEHIMEVFGLAPCAEIGIIKTKIKDAILEGEIRNSWEEAEQAMYRYAKELGLAPVKDI
ncbi:MAG: HD domain-containing protein [Flavobacteriia bacterium]|nr:HD domain-containing protein [Flavobacteriia bacterium]